MLSKAWACTGTCEHLKRADETRVTGCGGSTGQASLDEYRIDEYRRVASQAEDRMLGGYTSLTEYPELQAAHSICRCSLLRPTSSGAVRRVGDTSPEYDGRDVAMSSGIVLDSDLCGWAESCRFLLYLATPSKQCPPPLFLLTGHRPTGLCQKRVGTRQPRLAHILPLSSPARFCKGLQFYQTIHANPKIAPYHYRQFVFFHGIGVSADTLSSICGSIAIYIRRVAPEGKDKTDIRHLQWICYQTIKVGSYLDNSSRVELITRALTIAPGGRPLQCLAAHSNREDVRPPGGTY
ncbi:hypothetical protein F5146DRAFT_1120740 [Armillaria mellea]|nr:hypothetical protein F5146DRAFT_1120740 [Armillaria mellea]